MGISIENENMVLGFLLSILEYYSSNTNK